MSDLVEIRLERLGADAFAPFGQLLCAREEAPVFAGAHLRSWRQDFAVEGRTELMVIHYVHEPLALAALERHFRVTQTFIPLGGAASVMVAAPPTDPSPDRVPRPEEVRAFFVPGSVGLMLWRGTWHALTRFPLAPGGADFAFLTDAETQRELERERADGTPPRFTQAVDYRERFGVSFAVVDPDGLLAGA